MDTRKWKKTATPGIYKQDGARGAERFRVIFATREIVDGKTVTRQRSRVFSSPKGERVHRITSGTDSKLVTAYDAARHFKAEQDAARKAGRATDVTREDVTLEAFFGTFMASKVRRATTKDRYERSFKNWIAPTFGGRIIRTITPLEVRDWANGLTAGPAAKTSAVRVLKALFNQALADGLALRDPSKAISATDGRSEVRAVTSDEVYSDEQVARLREAIDDRYRVMLDLLCTGMRLGEVIGLRRMDVNLRGDVTIRRSISEVGGELVEGPPKTENSRRTLPLEYLRDELRRHVGLYAQPEADGYVFTGPRGDAPIRPNNWRDRVFYAGIEAAGLPRIVPHALRHRFAIDALDRGYTIHQVADWLGDTSAVVEKVYANFLPTSKMKIAADMGVRYREANSKE
jgi:integrase